jgi:hypothetical protein
MPVIAGVITMRRFYMLLNNSIWNGKRLQWEYEYEMKKWRPAVCKEWMSRIQWQLVECCCWNTRGNGCLCICACQQEFSLCVASTFSLLVGCGPIFFCDEITVSYCCCCYCCWNNNHDSLLSVLQFVNTDGGMYFGCFGFDSTRPLNSMFPYNVLETVHIYCQMS